ncbi:hypothetical protein HKBW3S06_00301 [Candidatus Hakubella thermalkaliphila]|uniref:Extradiol ring-cleavage dioxygenase class III enzyme subunit B domain-containing protein n=1 Tax=Candidatus Hakubella thermalkaliphila TaxID=2754717 RepID=A0A6V8NLG9_9ACTN|nr:class III extradiol dioxygenase subunit B-like domain-containing protein [Candidatus Hakubella thermalkaliphila]GFP21075.1 hypothetical protein HKBW3S06_00301 [Candidatus Hakubella thermalkaliphila]
MSGIIRGIIAPHPPIIVPEIGRGEISKVRKTIDSLNLLAEEVQRIKPELMIVISPHSPFFYDSFAINNDQPLYGDLSAFGASHLEFRFDNDLSFVEEVTNAARTHHLEVTPFTSRRTTFGRYGGLDHGVLVPVYYLARNYRSKIVNVSISGLDYKSHQKWGSLLDEVVEKRGERTIFVASGDLSHRLIPGAPAGYSPRGREFDEKIVEIVRSGDLASLTTLDADLIESAGECGLRPLITLHGCLDRKNYQCEFLSYEGPFGVGYLVAQVNTTTSFT